NELRKSGIEFKVVKNRLLKRASEGTETASMAEHFTGPCGLAMAYDDAIAPAKILVEQSKLLKKLEIKFGQIAGKLIDFEGIKRLSDLPSREVLLSQVLSAMQAVPTSFVRVLNGVILNLLYALKAIEKEKSGESEA
ncbi:MAG: 50S ribosomal protein L10, partial [Pseudomonadota bacterium]